MQSEHGGGHCRARRPHTPHGRPCTARCSQALERLQPLPSILHAARHTTLDQCIAMAHRLFHATFRDAVLDLTDASPEEARCPHSGEPIWSRWRRFPRALRFDASDPDHRGFIVAATRLFAACLGVALCPADGTPTDEYVARVAASLPAPRRGPGQCTWVELVAAAAAQAPGAPPVLPESRSSEREQVEALVEVRHAGRVHHPC